MRCSRHAALLLSIALSSPLAPTLAHSTPLDLTPHFNNQAFSTYPGESSFDALGQSYPVLPSNATTYVSSAGIRYARPVYRGVGEYDNVVCGGQSVVLGRPVRGAKVGVLHAGDVRKRSVVGDLKFGYADGSVSTVQLRSEPWWSFLAINRGEIIYSAFYTHNATNFNNSHIFELEAPLLPGKKLVNITLPDTTNATTGRIHVFAISLWQGGDEKIGGVSVQNVRPSQRWVDRGSVRGQVVEVVVGNEGGECVRGDGLDISIEGGGVRTVVRGSIKRLCPGDRKSADVAVVGSGRRTVNVGIKYRNRTTIHEFRDLEFGLTEWTDENDNLARHEAPRWFNDAKFGIFIHWGPYSVPAWGNSTPHESYAEWFWWYTTHRPGDKSGFHDYRLRTFGPDLNYDDFLANFTATTYKPKEWVDLIADAGARYFVVTTKHHDGFALFDAGNTTNRTSLHYGPRRDLVGELFEAAETYQPALKKGTYYSLPEWFNPSWGKYGFAQYGPERPDGTTHPGIIARNPYTNATEPYTGWIPVDDFIEDVMVPQMDILAYEYASDIMWCDAGASNGTAAFASRWWNWARTQGRDVAVNSRCGTAVVNDFDTPEYETFATAQARKWESNQGMDPYSYGYNRATPDAEYMNATTLVRTLVDMVSKNGNLLLNIGPRADGSIPQVEVDNLRKSGTWISAHAEAVFNTTYWFRKAEVRGDGTDVRFTQTDDALYVISLERPVEGRFVVEAPVPILEGDRVWVLGGDGEEEVEWGFDGEVLTLTFEQSIVDAREHAWVFKIEYLA